ncbi:hypothetical protein [Cupriavidus sp. CuC1]|uniref:hypothetical protein n=1 Tax=Cupriavidus sp. CuC1 TaxID=3373131 RepID=UPI0037D78551
MQAHTASGCANASSEDVIGFHATNMHDSDIGHNYSGRYHSPGEKAIKKLTFALTLIAALAGEVVLPTLTLVSAQTAYAEPSGNKDGSPPPGP